MPLGVPVGQDQNRRAARTGREKLRVNGIVLRPRRLDRAGECQDILLVQAVIRCWRSVIPLFAIRQDAVGVGAHEFAWIRVPGGTTDVFQSPGKRAHQTVVVRLPAALLITVDAACEPVVHSKRYTYSLPFYGGKRKHDERLVPDQFLIARLGRSSTTYRQAIYVQRLLPASLPSGSHVTTGALSGAISQAGGITNGMVRRFYRASGAVIRVEEASHGTTHHRH